LSERLRRAIEFIKGQRIDQLDRKAAAAVTPPVVRQERIERKPRMPVAADIVELPEYRLLEELVLSKEPQIVLLSGRAGTGKSVAIHWLRNRFDGMCAVCAPTGLAALQAGGQTIHSMFKFPPRPLQESDVRQPSRQSREVFAHLRVLIIDEISMVRVDVMEAIGKFLTNFGPKPGQPFGGVKLVLVGDLLQLSPVVETEQERAWIRHRYRSPYFFSADCFRQHSWVPIELTRVFRQSEQDFIGLLSDIRCGRNVRQSIDALNRTCVGRGRPEGVLEIALVPARHQAESINRLELERLPGPEVEFKGVLEGRMRADIKLPSPNDLRLRVGAQVMFTRNDKERRWVNGTMGKVAAVASDHVMVLIDGRPHALKVTPDRWEQFEYKWDAERKQLATDVVGAFVQIPLAHAWAATIHKAQGQTFDRALVDLGHGAFASGQTYVAVSRCRTREGLRLARAIREDDVKVDPQILALYDEMRKGTEGVDVEAMATALREARLGGTASSGP